MSTGTDAARARLIAHIAAQPTHILATMLPVVDTATGPEAAMVRAYMIEELERRYPAASAAVAAAFDAETAAIIAGNEDVAEVDYVAVLLENIPAAELAA